MLGDQEYVSDEEIRFSLKVQDKCRFLLKTQGECGYRYFLPIVSKILLYHQNLVFCSGKLQAVKIEHSFVSKLCKFLGIMVTSPFPILSLNHKVKYAYYKSFLYANYDLILPNQNNAFIIYYLYIIKLYLFFLNLQCYMLIFYSK